MNIAPLKQLPMLIANATAAQQQQISTYEHILKAVAKLSSITWVKPGDSLPAAATALSGEMQLLIPMQGLIDKDAELARLNKELEKITKEHVKAQEKLANPNYVNKAPPDVVEKEQQNLAALEMSISKINASIAATKLM
jgi:valyl-tRNA synthetase